MGRRGREREISGEKERKKVVYYDKIRVWGGGGGRKERREIKLWS